MGDASAGGKDDTGDVRSNQRLRLLRRLRGWTLEDVASGLHDVAARLGEREPGVDAHMVSRWERGVRRPSPRYVRLLAALFDVSPADLGLAEPPPRSPRSGTGRTEAASRRALLRRLSTIGGGILLDWERVAETMGGPLPADEQLVDDLAALTTEYAQRFHTVAPRDIMPAVRAHLAVLRGLLGRSQTAGIRTALQRVASETATLAGSFSRRSDNAGDAQAFYRMGRRLAAEATDGPRYALALVATSSLYSSVPFGSASGDPGIAIALLDSAETAAGAGAPPFLLAWLLARRAEERAAKGEEPPVLRDLDRAGQLLALAGPAPEGFFGNWDGARLDAFRGRSLRLLGRLDEGARLLADVLRRIDPALAADRTAAQIDLAEVQIRRREIEPACASLVSALRMAAEMGLASRIQRVHALRRHLGPWRDSRPVRELDEQLWALIDLRDL